MRVAFSFNGPNKLEIISFNNIVAMKISAVFECNSTNSSSANANTDESTPSDYINNVS